MLRDALSGVPEMAMAPQEEPEGEWGLRQSTSHERWDTARPHLVEVLLAAANVPKTCSLCSGVAVIRCLDCLPQHLFCESCDVRRHRHHVLHNREYFGAGFLQPIAPNLIAERQSQGTYALISEGMCKHIVCFIAYILLDL